ncbi:MAG: HDIG domain-containing protein, partial [Clostridia bacterium]
AGSFISNFLLVAVLFLGVHFNSRESGRPVLNFILALIMCAITYISCLAASGYLNIYAMPVALVTLVLIVLLDKRTTILATAIVAIMLVVSFMFNSEEASKLLLSQAIASIVCNSLGAVSINFFSDRHYTRLKFLLVSFVAAMSVFPFVIASTLAGGIYTITILWNMIYSYGANVAAILVFMPLVAIFEGIFNIADDFRLNELCNLSNPLLKRLASEAPGTFNHSLVVGNLAEACATAIDENPNLARCAAYYHDIGKLKAPVYFSENQSTYNPHDELIPEVSVSMITSHTVFGEILAKQYRLPPEIVAICREHHGTTPVGYFYRKALTLTEEGGLAVDNYKYAGPMPQTKIAAIIMISDTVEAALRSYMPDTKEEFEKRINKLVDEKLELRQFDECPITMSDIWKIKSTIIEVLPSIHHSRVSYDKKPQ